MDQITSVPTLNDGQQAAADAFMQFLFSDKKEFNISGPGGVGKTFLMSYMIDTIMPRYEETCKLMDIKPELDEVVMTATTNKAAEVLHQATKRPTSTIQSFLGLKVDNDYKTGKSKLIKSSGWKIHERKIIFIDECSMIDSTLYFHLHEATQDCKIVYVGDHCQLAPVMEKISPVYRNNIPFCELTEPVRNAGQPALMDICNQLRHTVETGEFLPIKTVPGVIDLLDADSMQLALESYFANQTYNERILAYTNDRVVAYNDHIRGIRQLPDHLSAGEFLVAANATMLSRSSISVEEELEITRINAHNSQVELGIDDTGAPIILDAMVADLRTRTGGYFPGVTIPKDMDHFYNLQKYFRKRKEWKTYFHLKERYPDLRPRDAGTVYKAQGSTYETVFIDLENISTCHNPAQAARMLYVAFSRAREKIILYGELAQKYGGVIRS